MANANISGSGVFDLVRKEQVNILSEENYYSDLKFPFCAKYEADDSERVKFFDYVYRGLGEQESTSLLIEPWHSMAKAWNDSDQKLLDNIAVQARQLPHLFQLAYIDTLAKFNGLDEAALKLLDYIRSSEESTIRSVIHALSGIATIRSIQELVAFLTRPNISHNLQLEITNLLKDNDLSHLQAELRSAINDIVLTSDEAYELKENLSSLLTAETVNDQDPLVTIEIRDQDLDKLLKEKISFFSDLSGEARRALRTAQFFHLQVINSGNVKTIDLSPAIDMQYKALELSFREKFEDVTFSLIKEGALQRKLDLIGYARPIPKAMDEFERYIENLPIISSIPFFSKFKLRKMLRAICQFRPGKRFTLDGSKAFALFLLCFSRKV